MAKHTPDIEQAPTSHKTGGEPGVETQQLPEVRAAAALCTQNKISEAEVVIVLNFKELQRQRIAELQDELLRLAVVTASGWDLPENHLTRAL